MSDRKTTLREALTNAIRYWEPRRILYNAVLIAVVAYHVLFASRHFYSDPTLDLLLILFKLAVLVNVAYCAAYVADVPAQLSGLRAQWIKFRAVVYVIGLAFAAVITHLVMKPIPFGV